MRVQFHESHERSAECLRLAVAAMAQQPAAWNPVTFAVWYAHASSLLAPLSADIEAALAQHVPITDDLVQRLYVRHLQDATEASASKATEELKLLLDGVESAAHRTDAQVSAVQQSLVGHETQLASSDGSNDLRSIVKAIFHDTRRASLTLDAFAVSLKATNEEIALLRKELNHARRQAGIDVLTGVSNRRGFDDDAAQILAEQHRDSAGLVLLMLDLDHFKQINDSFGHVFGDRVLKAVAQVIKASIKGRDVVARFGGEEFVVLLNGASLQGALSLADQVRVAISSAKIRRADGASIGTITVSIGVAAYRSGETLEQLIERADTALYQSKSEGRNRVTRAVDE